MAISCAQMIACRIYASQWRRVSIQCNNSNLELIRLVWTSYRGHSCWTANISAIVNLHVHINNVLTTTSLFPDQFLKNVVRLKRYQFSVGEITVCI